MAWTKAQMLALAEQMRERSANRQATANQAAKGRIPFRATVINLMPTSPPPPKLLLRYAQTVNLVQGGSGPGFGLVTPGMVNKATAAKTVENVLANAGISTATGTVPPAVLIQAINEWEEAQVTEVVATPQLIAAPMPVSVASVVSGAQASEALQAAAIAKPNNVPGPPGTNLTSLAPTVKAQTGLPPEIVVPVALVGGGLALVLLGPVVGILLIGVILAAIVARAFAQKPQGAA